jgi:hypothetical protein
MQDFQEQTAKPYPLFVKGDYHEEVNHPFPVEITEQHDEEKKFPTSPVYDDYESNPWESQEEELEEQFISCSELVREQPSPKNNQPTSSSNPLVPTRDIHPCVRSCVAEKAAYYKYSRIHHSLYEPVNDYMEWNFIHILDVSTNSCKGVFSLWIRALGVKCEKWGFETHQMQFIQGHIHEHKAQHSNNSVQTRIKQASEFIFQRRRSHQADQIDDHRVIAITELHEE